MADTILRASSMNGEIRIFVADTTQLVRKAKEIHDLYPVPAAAMGRMLTAASMMGIMLKEDNASLTLKLAGDGPIEKVIVSADSKGRVKGYTPNPHISVEDKVKGHLNVGGAFGNGTLSLVSDIGIGEPHTARINLVSGEVAEDIAAYYAQSEQVPTAVALGVLIDKDGSVICSGGYILQLMPGASDETAKKLEENIKNAPSVTNMMKSNMSTEDILLEVTKGVNMLIYNEKILPKYECSCSEKKVSGALISLGKKEIASIIEEQGKASLTCQFCNKVYEFDKTALESILKKAINNEKNRH